MKYPERLVLANLPTPIHKLDRLSKEVGKEIYIWRDDSTGFVESGNKIRKLEFLLAEAIRQKATAVITCGGPQSNHVRATAFLACRLGLKAHAVIRLPEDSGGDPPAINGNLLLHKISGMATHYISYREYVECGQSYDSFLKEQKAYLKSCGEVPYLIPEGGSNALGCLGYVRATTEMLATWNDHVKGSKSPDQLFCALGSGGTLAGLSMGYAIHQLNPENIRAINVCYNKEYFQSKVRQLIDQTSVEYGFKGEGTGHGQIVEGYIGEGYAKATLDELEFYRKIAQQEGVLLDPCYTGKAFIGMVTELKRSPEKYGSHILFLHSGGGFSTFAFENEYKRLILR